GGLPIEAGMMMFLLRGHDGCAVALPSLHLGCFEVLDHNTSGNGAESSGGSGGGVMLYPRDSCLDQSFGCPDNFKTRLAAFKLEGDALSWWKAHLHTQYGSIYRLVEEFWGSTCRGFTRLASFVGTAVGDAQRQVAVFAVTSKLLHESGNSNKRDRDGNRIQNRGQGQQENKGRHDQDFRGSAGEESSETVASSTSLYYWEASSGAKTSGTITGNLYIDDRTVFVLFDTGATHSIISTTFAKKLNMNPTPLIERIIISTPMKNHMLIDHEYVNCPLCFDDRIRPANLLPIHMLDFDVILGMDWLASHRATIDCYARTVIFGNVRQPEFVYHGSSPLKSVKLLCYEGTYLDFSWVPRFSGFCYGHIFGES
ncbi:reverse transcriptase domain-containing protein, partial [Tanacetum coccineum]